MTDTKLGYSILAGVLFFLFASPFMFHLTQKYIGDPLKLQLVKGSVPTMWGLAVHGMLYALVTRILMMN